MIKMIFSVPKCNHCIVSCVLRGKICIHMEVSMSTYILEKILTQFCLIVLKF